MSPDLDCGFDEKENSHAITEEHRIGTGWLVSLSETRVRPLTGPAPNGAGLNGLALAWR